MGVIGSGWKKKLKWFSRNLTEKTGKYGSEPQRILLASHPNPETSPY